MTQLVECLRHMEEVRGSSPLLRTKGKGQAEGLVSFCPWCAIRDSLPVSYAGKRMIRGALYRGNMPRYIRGERKLVKEIRSSRIRISPTSCRYVAKGNQPNGAAPSNIDEVTEGS